MDLRFLFFGFLLVTTAASAQKDLSTSQTSTGRLDTNVIALLPVGENANWFKSNQSFQLTQDDFHVIDSLLQICVAKNNNYQKDTSRQRWNNYIHFNQYKRQYVSFLSNGERKVFVNCFHSSFVDRNNERRNSNRGSKYFIDWHKQMVNVDGGGRNFFSVFINLTSKSYYDFWINAPI